LPSDTRAPAQRAADRSTVRHRLLHIGAMARVLDPSRSGALRVAGYYASYTWRFS